MRVVGAGIDDRTVSSAGTADGNRPLIPGRHRPDTTTASDRTSGPSALRTLAVYAFEALRYYATVLDRLVRQWRPANVDAGVAMESAR